jgi:cytochrome c oxidase assembly protein subunit 15
MLLVTLMRRLALASLIANIALVVTGAAVRLTSSGLGCPTWPRCTDQSYVTTPEMGVYGVIEFGNRLLGILLGLIALATFVVALRLKPRRRSLVVLSLVAGLGIPGQGVIGGITVLTDLNPWVVGLHFLLSMALIAVTYALWQRTEEGDEPARRLVPQPLHHLALITTLASTAVIVVGVIVTGSGLDPATISQVHADLVFLLIGLSVALWFALRAVKAPATAIRAATMFIAVELSQGLIGFVQYFTHLPVILVGCHLLGAALVWTATLNVLWKLRERPVATPAEPSLPTAAPEPAPVG